MVCNATYVSNVIYIIESGVVRCVPGEAGQPDHQLMLSAGSATAHAITL